MADRSEIDEVRARVDLVSIVEQYVTLKRNGKNLKGLCPFHNEKTPSFLVNPDLGRWHCFGQCGEGGDVFKFVQKIENLSFAEALERLALRAGVTLSRQRSPAANSPGQRTSEAGESDRLYRVNALALRYYRDMLGRSSLARDYLGERGLAHAIQEDFRLGFAPDVWDGLVDHLSRQGAAMADAEKAGLVSKTDRGGYIDKLRGRLIFPILDVHERPVAFGGRLIGEARPGQPKYWNSPETPVFSKSRTLYGLWRARKAIAAQGQAIIVEGYTDVIAAHQAGFENVVATLGTALTEEHVNILARLASTVLLAFDADSAGLKAAFRAAAIFEVQEVDVRVLDLPEGEDPDSLLRSGKRLVFERAIGDALPLTEYRLKRLIQKGPTGTERDRVALFRKALPILAAVPSVIEREQYIKVLAPYHPHYGTGAAFAEEHIRQDVTAYQSGRRGDGAPLPSPPMARSIALPALLPGGATEQAEHHLLRALVSGDPALAGTVLTGISPEEFPTPNARALAAQLFEYYARTQSLETSGMLAAIEDEALAALLTTLVLQEEEPLTPRMLEEEIDDLKLRVKKRLLSELKAQIEGGAADKDILTRFVRLQSDLKGTPEPLRHNAGER